MRFFDYALPICLLNCLANSFCLVLNILTDLRKSSYLKQNRHVLYPCHSTPLYLAGWWQTTHVSSSRYSLYSGQKAAAPPGIHRSVLWHWSQAWLTPICNVLPTPDTIWHSAQSSKPSIGCVSITVNSPPNSSVFVVVGVSVIVPS